MSRWWRASGKTIEAETAAFVQVGLDFSLDERFLAERNVVVFRGLLCRGSRAHEATVVYPPSYGEGEHPNVFAPSLPLGRHWRPSDGLLCLDHLRDGDDRPMTGAEAVLRAIELWRLVEEDPDELARQEVDAPYPQAELYDYDDGGLVYLLEPDVAGAAGGWLRFQGTVGPLRGQITGISAGNESSGQAALVGALGGPRLLLGQWRRLSKPPPLGTSAETAAWALTHHADLVARAVSVSRIHAHIHKSATRTVIAFVFPDEGPTRRETQDTWLALCVDLDGRIEGLSRVVALCPKDHFVRQPGMAQLAELRVVLVGTGALGSHVAVELARAGVGRLDLIDPEPLDPGNVVRHELTLRDAGWPKTHALANRLAAINPFCVIRTAPFRIGAAADPAFAGQAQRLHDALATDIVAAGVVVNCTAAAAPGRWLASVADAVDVPVIHVAVSAGAWGSRIHVQRHAVSGCPECLARHQEDCGGVVPAWSEDPFSELAVGRGCNQPSFAAPDFELAETAAAASRVAVQVLLSGKGYPSLDYDIATLRFRDESSARPEAQYTALPRHSACGCCGP